MSLSKQAQKQSCKTVRWPGRKQRASINLAARRATRALSRRKSRRDIAAYGKLPADRGGARSNALRKLAPSHLAELRTAVMTDLNGNKCAACPATTGLNACGGCKFTLYCSIDCQRAHRAEHKGTCDWSKALAAAKFSNNECGHCKAQSKLTDYMCACLKTFCSEECKNASAHVRGSTICQHIENRFETFLSRRLNHFRESHGEMTESEMNDFGHVLYLKGLMMITEPEPSERTKTLSRMLIIHAAKLLHKSAVARVGNFTNEELVQALTFAV